MSDNIFLELKSVRKYFLVVGKCPIFKLMPSVQQMKLQLQSLFRTKTELHYHCSLLCYYRLRCKLRIELNLELNLRLELSIG